MVSVYATYIQIIYILYLFPLTVRKARKPIALLIIDESLGLLSLQPDAAPSVLGTSLCSSLLVSHASGTLPLVKDAECHWHCGSGGVAGLGIRQSHIKV